MYGREPNLPTALNFQVPVSKFPILETDYGVALEKELNLNLPKHLNLEALQKQQKKYYDKKVKNLELKAGDLVMLKIQPKFKLDRQFQGPFIILSLTATNAILQAKDDKNGETIIVSRQRLSKCGVHMAKATSWLGQSGKLRKRRTVRKLKPLETNQEAQVNVGDDVTGHSNPSPHSTQLGQDVLSRNLGDLLRKIAPMGKLLKEGEVVRHHVHKMMIGRAHVTY